MSDDFKTVYFRIDAGTRSTVCDFSEHLNYGDSLKVVFDGVEGITVAHAVAGLQQVHHIPCRTR